LLFSQEGVGVAYSIITKLGHLESLHRLIGQSIENNWSIPQAICVLTFMKLCQNMTYSRFVRAYSPSCTWYTGPINWSCIHV